MKNSPAANSVFKFYDSKEWFALRQSTLRDSGYKCSCCGGSVRGKGKSRVDHIVPVKRDWSKRLDPANLRILCPSCDNKRHAEKGRGVETEEIGLDGFPASWR